MWRCTTAIFRRFTRPVSSRPRTSLSHSQFRKRVLLGTGVATTVVCVASAAQAIIYADVSLHSIGSTSSRDEKASTEFHLGQYSMTNIPDEGSGIMRIDSLVIGSNVPCEDSVGIALEDNSTICSIFDGHNGFITSQVLSNKLPLMVLEGIRRFGRTVEESSTHSELGDERTLVRSSDQGIDAAIKQTFLHVDNMITNNIEYVLSTKLNATTVRDIEAALSGSCALLSYYEHDTRQLRVAVTGDSRAVLGRPTTAKSGKTSYDVHILSVDQNAHNPAEVARLEAEHPDETIAENGRVLGWGISRAFGDGLMKWSLDKQERLRNEHLGSRPYSNVKTPPYFTAEPEITTTQVQKGDFMIMASDGFWECLTSEEAVGLVGLWLQKNKLDRKPHAPILPQGHIAGPNAKPVERDELPVILKEDNTVRYRFWRATKKFLNVDTNVIIHLARNALGGANRDLTGALLALNPPRSRRYRDDMSVIVVFFD